MAASITRRGYMVGRYSCAHRPQSALLLCMLSMCCCGQSDAQGPPPPGWHSYPCDTFDEGASGWLLHGAHTPGPTSTCGNIGDILGGYNILGHGASAIRTYSNLPYHDKVALELIYVKIDSWDSSPYEHGEIFIDGELVWRREMTMNEPGQACECGNPNFACGAWSMEYEVEVDLDEVLTD